MGEGVKTRLVRGLREDKMGEGRGLREVIGGRR
jgi:hypothetical protein